MEELDLRVYTYGSGTLNKARFHKVKSFEGVEKIKNWYKSRNIKVQLVVTQYLGSYQSRIINVIDV